MHATTSIVHDSKIQISLPIQYVCSPTINKIIELSPNFILGESKLFSYQESKIVPSPTFKELIELLVQLNELDARVLEAKTIPQLNDILQQPKGGLLRTARSERWELEDSVEKQLHRNQLQELFKKLGLVTARAIEESIKVDFCILFGGRVERMEKRIHETLNYLKQNLQVNEKLLLLGSNRKLITEELEFLKTKLEIVSQEQKEKWQAFFEDPSLATEANAFLFLWEVLVPIEMQMQDKLVAIQSTRVGVSYQNAGDRPTTEVTVEDWLPFYNPNKPQSLFAVVEQPYIRLLDQQRFTLLTIKKKANLNELHQRIQNTVFHFATAEASSIPLISVVLDEIARNVFRINETIHFLQNL